MHWPKVSEKKKQELEQLKLSIQTSPTKRNKSPKSRYSTAMNAPNDSISAGNQDFRANSENEGEKGSLTRKKIIWPENSLKPKPKEKKEIKVYDYLKEQRLKND